MSAGWLLLGLLSAQEPSPGEVTPSLAETTRDAAREAGADPPPGDPPAAVSVEDPGPPLSAPGPAPRRLTMAEVLEEPRVERAPALPGARVASLGALLGLAPWLPVAVICCASGGMMATVYPLSGGSPVMTGVWWMPCMFGVFVGMAGWVLGLLGALVGPLASSAGLMVGLGADARSTGKLSGQHLVAIAVGAVSGLAAMAPSLAAAFLSGFLPWLSVLVWVLLAPSLPRNGVWTYARWFGLNALFMGAVVAGLGLVAVAATTPVAAAMLGWLGASRMVPDGAL